MTPDEILTKADLEQFKEELFSELRKANIRPNSKMQIKEWLKSYEVRKLLDISPGTLQNLRVKWYSSLHEDRWPALLSVLGYPEALGGRTIQRKLLSRISAERLLTE